MNMTHFYRIELLVESGLATEEIADLVDQRQHVFGSRIEDASVHRVTTR